MTNETAEDTLRQEEIVWFAVCVTEFIAIFVINAVTIIAFARNHHLRKRSTYLIARNFRQHGCQHGRKHAQSTQTRIKYGGRT